MKKSLIALAVAGAMTAPMIAQADATLSGLVETRVVAQEDNDLDVSATKIELGVAGTVDNNIEGLETGYQINWRFDGSTSDADQETGNSPVVLRKAHAWVAGDFGRLDLGRQNNPSEAAQWSMASRNGGSFQVNPDFINNGVVYYSPEVAGFQLAAGVGVDAGLGEGADGKDGDDVDLTSIALTGNVAGVGIALAQFSAENSSDLETAKDGVEITLATLTYDVDALSFGVAYEDVDYEVNNTETDFNSLTVGAAYSMDAVTLYAEYAEMDVDGGSAADDDMMAVGVWYALGAKAKVGVEYADYDLDGSDNLTIEYELHF